MGTEAHYQVRAPHPFWFEFVTRVSFPSLTTKYLNLKTQTLPLVACMTEKYPTEETATPSMWEATIRTLVISISPVEKFLDFCMTFLLVQGEGPSYRQIIDLTDLQFAGNSSHVFSHLAVTI